MSAICPRFVQNAWKKDLCSNCFKSKEEHVNLGSSAPIKPIPVPPPNAEPTKSIIKSVGSKKHKRKVSFPKEVSKVIGFGGDWTDSENSDNEPNPSSTIKTTPTPEEIEEDEELQKLTKVNTDFNMNNGNLLGDPTANIKRSFAALKLGTPLKDSDGKKQTLKISVTPFGGASDSKSTKVDAIKNIFGSKEKKDGNIDTNPKPVVLKTVIKTINVNTTTTMVTVSNKEKEKETNHQQDEKKDSPCTESASNEKTLLEEISETLEKNKSLATKNSDTTEGVAKNESEISGEHSTKVEISNPVLMKASLEAKRTITRNIPIKKDSSKPKISVFPKSPESDSNGSDFEMNGVSDYYDVVETVNSYENVPDGFAPNKAVLEVSKETKTDAKDAEDQVDKSESESFVKNKKSFFSSQLISDMFLTNNKTGSDQIRKRSEVYNLSDSSYITSKITSDGLIVTKSCSEDPLDSTGSSFDSSSSSDEDMSSMNRSESDSGIGICITNDYKNIDSDVRINEFKGYEKKTSVSSNSSDYEDVQVQKEDKNLNYDREMAGEPDGRSDPDGSAEAPALPSSPPPIVESRPSFLHGTQKQMSSAEKPKVPVKPVVTVIKQFPKKPQNIAQQQVIKQLQQVMKPIESEERPVLQKQDSIDSLKTPKKCRAPNPPSSTQEEHDVKIETNKSNIEVESVKEKIVKAEKEETKDVEMKESKSAKINLKTVQEESISTLYMRNPSVTVKSTSPVVREKDKRERATINPKFRSLNNINSNSHSDKNHKPSTPEPAPRRSLSLSQDSLIDDKKPKKNKFSIKKFLRMGSSSKVLDGNCKKEISYGIEGSIGELNFEGIPQAKPRLVIIHPLDINNQGVEVVKDCREVGNTDSSLKSIVTGKPPAPPQRFDGTRLQEINKPARPPPPKSAELRRKQKLGFSVSQDNSPEPVIRVLNNDNVYANLGEVRSSIAPRKPERTASMREREMELHRRRPIGDNTDSASDISSTTSTAKDLYDDSFCTISKNMSDASDRLVEEKRGNFVNKENDYVSDSDVVVVEQIPVKAENNSEMNKISNNKSYNDSFNERKKKIMETEFNNSNKLSNKIEIFEKSSLKQSYLNDGIKNSVQKMNSTIDNYLKNKLISSSETNIYDTAGSVSPTSTFSFGQVRNFGKNNVELRNISTALTYETFTLNTNNKQRSSFPDNVPQSGSITGFRKTANDFNKYTSSSFANLPRVTSLSYCGSEMGESEIYSPYSFCGSEAGTDIAQGDPNDGWSNTNSTNRSGKTINRLRMRKGRSVVHKNLEDNYGAVVVANHEALAQVLEQLQQTPPVPVTLRPLANCLNLRFDDFTVIEGAIGVVIGRRAFHAAVWNNCSQVTLSLTADFNQTSGVNIELNQFSGAGSGTLTPITEFCDLVPSNYLPLMPTPQIRMVQASISIFPKMHIDTLQSLGAILKSRSMNATSLNSGISGSLQNLSTIIPTAGSKLSAKLADGDTDKIIEANGEVTVSPNGTIKSSSSINDILCREVGFVMLQLVNGLKNLQAKGIEEMPLSLSNVILCKEAENKDAQARLCVLQGINQDLSRDEDEPMGTLCQCAHIALTSLLPQTKLTPILSHILLQERSETLSRSKSVLEYVLWGPSDVSLIGPIKERELALQRWLDLERATVLHGLVRSRVELTVYDECHLMFLVRSSAKTMGEASSIIANYKENSD